MRFIYDAFVIIHIRLSHITVKNIQARTIVTFTLLILTFFGLYEFYISLMYFKGFVDFIEAAAYLIFIIYIIFYWLTSWVKANRMLNKAYGYDSDDTDDKNTDHSHKSNTTKDHDAKDKK